MKKISKQKKRTIEINKLLGLWSKIIRKNTPYCVWCGATDRLQAHHIVSRGITKNNKHSWFLIENGMTLCYKCHMFRIKSDVDEYIKTRDDYLKSKNLNYFDMKKMYQVTSKLRNDDLALIRYYLNSFHYIFTPFSSQSASKSCLI